MSSDTSSQLHELSLSLDVDDVYDDARRIPLDSRKEYETGVAEAEYTVAKASKDSILAPIMLAS